MKGVHVVISAALIILVTVAAVAIVLDSLLPVLERNKEQMIFEEGKANLEEINNAVSSVVFEGDGSSRLLSLGINGGEYVFNSTEDSISFILETKQEILKPGLVKEEGGIEIRASQGLIEMKISYSNVDISNDLRFGKGNRRLLVRNAGYSSGKSILAISEG